MQTLAPRHPVAWAPPRQLWEDSTPADMRRPVIFRFAQDDFMEELHRILARDPDGLRARIAVPETWRGIRRPARTPNPTGGRAGLFSRLGVAARRGKAAAVARPTPSTDAAEMPLKLYQPAHQRYYLVASSLVCQLPGLPDRKVDVGHDEKASFVIRRWFPPANGVDTDLPEFDATRWTEHAYVAQADGRFSWVPVAVPGAAESTRAVVLPEEERLPLFPSWFDEDDGRKRRLLAGLVPVGKREAYHAAARVETGTGTPLGGATDDTARKALLRKTVSEPWKAILDQARRVQIAVSESPDPNPDPDGLASLLLANRSSIQHGAWLVLADLAAFLATYLPAVHAAIRLGTTPASGPARALLLALRGVKHGATFKAVLSNDAGFFAASLEDALARFIRDDNVLTQLERADEAFVMGDTANPLGGDARFPRFLFPLADPVHTAEPGRPSLPAGGDGSGPEPVPPVTSPFDPYKRDVDRLTAMVLRAMEYTDDQPEPEVPAAAFKPADMRDGWFHVRCVYERPACGVLHQAVVSAPSDPFQLAGYFDPDAPARPIRIGLPIDTTPAGLRKFDKNTAFVMSDVLCGQVARMKGITFGDLVLSVLPWPFHKNLSVPKMGPCESNGVSMGMICSLSIPIITLCALILLIIMVALLDFIFRWIPFLMVCFPLPGLRAKKS